MGTKKGGARKGKIAGSRLAFDDTKQEKKEIKRKKKRHSVAEGMKKERDDLGYYEGHYITTKSGIKIWMPSDNEVRLFQKFMRRI
tara:strand:+ start:344 stop:598 length:255 start_codon:yes stop_codon:yes gene_type:complete